MMTYKIQTIREIIERESELDVLLGFICNDTDIGEIPSDVSDLKELLLEKEAEIERENCAFQVGEDGMTDSERFGV